MARRTQKQLQANRRNSAKWRMLGILAQLRNLSCNADYTPHEKERFQQAAEILAHLEKDWNENNTWFGLNNPDTNKEKK